MGYGVSSWVGGGLVLIFTVVDSGGTHTDGMCGVLNFHLYILKRMALSLGRSIYPPLPQRLCTMY